MSSVIIQIHTGIVLCTRGGQTGLEQAAWNKVLYDASRDRWSSKYSPPTAITSGVTQKSKLDLKSDALNHHIQVFLVLYKFKYGGPAGLPEVTLAVMRPRFPAAMLDTMCKQVISECTTHIMWF